MSATGQIDAADLVALAQELVRFPSPQTERMEAEPAVQEFIGNCVVPLLARRGLSGRRDRMGNLTVEMGPVSNECSLLLMTYAMTHPASAMTDPYSANDRGSWRRPGDPRPRGRRAEGCAGGGHRRLSARAQMGQLTDGSYSR